MEAVRALTSAADIAEDDQCAPRFPPEPGSDQQHLVHSMLADLEVAVASFDRAGLGEQHLLLLRQKAALLTHYGLRDEAASVPQLRDCHRRLADTPLGERRPGELMKHRSDMHMVYRLLAQVEIDQDRVDEAFAISTSVRAAFANRLLVDDDAGELPAPVWERFARARRDYLVAVDHDVDAWFALRDGRAPTGHVRQATRARAAARLVFEESLIELDTAAPREARRLRGDGLSATAVAARLTPEQALIEIHPLADRTVAYVATSDGTAAVPVGPGFGEPETSVSRRHLSAPWLAGFRRTTISASEVSAASPTSSGCVERSPTHSDGSPNVSTSRRWQSASRACAPCSSLRTTVAHLSCHGDHRYIYGAIYHSELILAGRDTLPVAEFFRNLSPDRNRLVVLSACDSGAPSPSPHRRPCHSAARTGGTRPR